MIIGGAEDKVRKPTILEHFVALSGGHDARIAVIPTASSLGREVVGVYDALFTKFGAARVDSVRPESREQAHDPALVKVLDEATGVFMTGGNQLKLSSIACGTPVGEAVLRAHERGAVVAGTSAGASIQSSHMVAFGVGGSTPKQRMTQVAAGLGLLDAAVIDQHFDQRNRYGRLLMIVAQSPQLLGIGVDEDTCGLVEDVDGELLMRVLGKGAVTVFDGSRMVSNAHEATRSSPVLASGVVFHTLPEGAVFNLSTRALVAQEPVIEPEDADELAEATRDLRRLARDIAAADATPAAIRRRLKLRRPTADQDPDPTQGEHQ
jgi:cyanophycinase